MDTHDVVVVGARVAGASTAMLLARAGLRVALLDRGHRGSDTPSTHGLMRAGVLQLARWGLLGEVVGAGTPPVRRSAFTHPDGERVQVAIRPSPGVDALYAPRRFLLDRILVDAAEDAGADVRHRTAVTSLLGVPGGRVRGVRVRGADGTESELSADVVVGADGVGSAVARHVGAPVLRTGRAASAILYRYVHDLPVAGYEWAHGAGAAAGLIPTNAGATCVFVGTTPARMRLLRRSGVEHAFAALLGAADPLLPGRVRDAGPATPVRGWAGPPGYVRRAWGPGWTLVGDAGSYKDPLSSHGITDALRDAELVSDAVLEVLAGGATERRAFAAWEAVRDRLSDDLFTATDALAGYGWDADGARLLLRRTRAAMRAEVAHLEALAARPGGRGTGVAVALDQR